jgi:DDE family transposase
LESAQHTEFATIRLRLLKFAGRIIETASRIRIALASCCPEAETFSLVALKLTVAGAQMPPRPVQ